MTDDKTIFAVASGRVRSGVAVVRVSGPASSAALESLAGSLPEPRTATLRTLVSRETGDVLDRALVLWFPGPGSFTGEDVAELHLHGSPAVLAAVLEELGGFPDLRPADPGEFTRCAFANGRLDLTQVEGLADLINADTQAQRRQAQRQMDGALGRIYDDWRDRLTRCLAYLEAEIDFADEADVPGDVAANLKSKLGDISQEIDTALKDQRRGERLRDGLRIVIAGRPNVGKSSLLNALARRDAAIVSDYAGTTRDVIEVHMDLAGYPVDLIDTAGLREADDVVEREGVKRTLTRMEDADLVLWVTDPSDRDLGRPDDIPAGSDVWAVLNKTDLLSGGPAQSEDRGGGARGFAVSAKTGDGLAGLMEALAVMAGELFAGGESAVVTRERHRQALRDCLAHLSAAQAAWGGEVELVAEDVRLAMRALGRVTGRVDVEDLLDVIFRDFCIGK